MKKMSEVLINIAENIEGNLKCSVASIHKIKHDKNFEELVETYKELSDAAYVVYSNYNQIRECEFLDARGGHISSVSGVKQSLVYDTLDFEIEHYNIVENHPFNSALHHVSSDSLKLNFG